MLMLRAGSAGRASLEGYTRVWDSSGGVHADPRHQIGSKLVYGTECGAVERCRSH